jgi:hypothetical protein
MRSNFWSCAVSSEMTALPLPAFGPTKHSQAQQRPNHPVICWHLLAPSRACGYQQQRLLRSAPPPCETQPLLPNPSFRRLDPSLITRDGTVHR